MQLTYKKKKINSSGLRRHRFGTRLWALIKHTLSQSIILPTCACSVTPLKFSNTQSFISQNAFNRRSAVTECQILFQIYTHGFKVCPLYLHRMYTCTHRSIQVCQYPRARIQQQINLHFTECFDFYQQIRIFATLVHTDTTFCQLLLGQRSTTNKLLFHRMRSISSSDQLFFMTRV